MVFWTEAIVLWGTCTHTDVQAEKGERGVPASPPSPAPCVPQHSPSADDEAQGVQVAVVGSP